MFTSTKLRQVVGIDRAGSFSRASKNLNVSQSTLTKAVLDVEQDIGFALFHRTAKGVVSTPEGREFLNRAARIVADFDMLVDDAKSRKVESDNVLRVGISPSSVEGLFNNSVPVLLKERPEINLTMIGVTIERGVRLVKRGDIDMLFAPMIYLQGEKELEIQQVASIEVVLFCRKGHPILKVERPSPMDVQAYKVIYSEPNVPFPSSVSDKLFGEGNDPTRRLQVVENFSVVAETVAVTNLIGVVGRKYAESRTFSGRFALVETEIFFPLDIGVARIDQRLLGPASRAMLDVLKRYPIA